MKAILFISTILLMTFSAELLAQNALPAAANNYIEEHFPDASISNSKIDGNEHEVYLNNGIELEFDRSGNIKEIEGNGTPVPSSVLPEKIVSYINQNYPGHTIQEVEFERNGYEVELSNGLELEFNKEGDFLKIDD